MNTSEHMKAGPKTLIGGIRDSIAKTVSNWNKSAPIDEEKKPIYTVTKETDGLIQHLSDVSNWAKEISFRDLLVPKKLADSFIDLDLYLGTRGKESVSKVLVPSYRENEEINGTQSVSKVSELPICKENIVIIGDPGAGKTTSLKKCAQTILGQKGDSFLYYPILVRMRDLQASGASLIDAILGILGVHFHFSENLSAPRAKYERKERFIIDILRSVRFIGLFDGLDETSFENQNTIINEYQTFVFKQDLSKFILTCRTGSFVYNMENCKIYEICLLTADQVKDFCARWLSYPRAKEFVLQIRNTPYAGTEITPLTLAHLCAIYERMDEIPEKPKSLYRKIVKLFLEEWDEQRRIKRRSQYANFQVDRKEEFLQVFAWEIANKCERALFSHDEMLFVYKAIFKKFSLPGSDAENVIREIQSHTGLIIKTSFDTYEFSHKCIHEYLVASYLNKLPRLPIGSVLVRFPEEVALAVGLSSEPNEYFLNVVRGLILGAVEDLRQFSVPFLTRIRIEKTDFYPDQRLGAALCFLYSANLHFDYESATEDHFLQMTKIYEELAKSEALTESMKMFFSNCTFQRGRRGLIKVISKENDWLFLRFELSNQVFLPEELLVDYFLLDKIRVKVPI